MDKFVPTIEQVNADERGEIYSITLPGDKELMLLHSKAGSLRGGHSHDVDEVVVMLTGWMNYYKKDENGQEWVVEMNAGRTSFNPKGQIHMGDFITDSWVLEWKLNTRKGEWKNTDDQAWRERVKANAETASPIV